MAAVIFNVWTLVLLSLLQVCSGDSSECYKIDGAKDVSPKGIYVGYIISKNQTIGSIQITNTTGSTCVCNFPGGHYSIQNVTYYGDKEIPKIESLFQSGCRIINIDSLEKPGYRCTINITVSQQRSGVRCSNKVTATTLSPESTTVETKTKQTTSPPYKATTTTTTERYTSPTYTTTTISTTTTIPTTTTTTAITTTTAASTPELTTSQQQKPTTTVTTTLGPGHSSSKKPSTKTKATSKLVPISNSKTTNRPTSSESTVSTTSMPVTHNQKSSTFIGSTTKMFTTTITPSVVTGVTSTRNKNNDPTTSSDEMTSSNVDPSVEYGGSSTKHPTGEHIETTTKKKARSKGDSKLEIVIPVIVAVVFIIFIIAVFICIRKQREKKRIFKYEVSPTPSMRSHKESDKEEILQYNNDFYNEHGTKHNILYEGEDYCEHGIFNKAFIDTHPEATERKKEDRVYAPTLEGGYSAQPDDLVLEEE